MRIDSQRIILFFKYERYSSKKLNCRIVISRYPFLGSDQRPGSTVLTKMLANTRVRGTTSRFPSKSARGGVAVAAAPLRWCPRLCAQPSSSKRRNQSTRASSTEIPSVSKSEEGGNEGRGVGELTGNDNQAEAEGKRIGIVERKTKETSVYVKLNLDGTGQCDAVCGVPFLEHMLDVRPFPFLFALLPFTTRQQTDRSFLPLLQLFCHHTNLRCVFSVCVCFHSKSRPTVS